jgi:hypothetical protein
MPSTPKPWSVQASYQAGDQVEFQGGIYVVQYPLLPIQSSPDANPGFTPITPVQDPTVTGYKVHWEDEAAGGPVRVVNPHLAPIKIWNPELTYQRGDIVDFGGKYYLSKTVNQPTLDPDLAPQVNPQVFIQIPPGSSDTIPGKPPVTIIGDTPAPYRIRDWRPGVPYKEGDLLRAGENIYLVSRDGEATNTLPVPSRYQVHDVLLPIGTHNTYDAGLIKETQQRITESIKDAIRALDQAIDVLHDKKPLKPDVAAKLKQYFYADMNETGNRAQLVKQLAQIRAYLSREVLPDGQTYTPHIVKVYNEIGSVVEARADPPYHRMLFNADLVKRLSKDELLDLTIHEASHVGAQTLDYWYSLGPTDTDTHPTLPETKRNFNYAINNAESISAGVMVLIGRPVPKREHLYYFRR